jgi:hypothetical protein
MCWREAECLTKIIKGDAGEICPYSKEGEFTEFVAQWPISEELKNKLYQVLMLDDRMM